MLKTEVITSSIDWRVAFGIEFQARYCWLYT